MPTIIPLNSPVGINAPDSLKTLEERTPERLSKKEYFAQLRRKWQLAKELSENPEYKEKLNLLKEQSPTLQVSAYSFAFTLNSMERQGLDGLPYLDCKTFLGWKTYGYQVRKGETAKIEGITWIKPVPKDLEDQEEDQEDGQKNFVYPKLYKLFHHSQVDPISR